MTALILQTFRLHGALIAAGDRLTSAVDLTAARWQVLSSVVRAAQAGPVSHVARDMGLTRQAVQRIADHLVADGLLAFAPNPHHKRAPRLVATPEGREVFTRIAALQVPWVNALARGVSREDIATAMAVLKELEARLAAPASSTPRTARSGPPVRRGMRAGAKPSKPSRT